MGIETATNPKQPPGVAEGLFLLHDLQWRRKVYLGGLLLMIPFVGWFATLGYRKALISRLYAGDRPPLPEWRGEVWTHIWEGMKATFVIFSQYLPLYAILIRILIARGAEPGPIVIIAGVIFALFPIFSPLAFPLAVVYWWFPGGAELLHIGEAIGLIGGYTLVTFIIPTGFIQVSLRGRYSAAFRYHNSIPFMFRNFRSYVMAWYRSMAMSMCGHFAIPFSPWGVLWCYLGIIYSFNKVLADDLASRGELSAESWFVRLEGAEAITLTPIGKWTAKAGDGTKVAIVGPVYIPLPNIVAKRIFRASVEA